MSNIKHIILTRFNVASPGREEKIRLRSGWLDRRFQLFEDYCLPSVAYQTVSDFEWIIFFDAKTPSPYRKRIELLRERFPFSPEYTEIFEMRNVAPLIASRRNSEDWLLTTRLDSDDVLGMDFVHRVRHGLKMQERQVVNFLNGAILSLTDVPKLYLIQDRSNPFASLLERFNAEARTIWSERHVDLERMGRIEQIDAPPAWMQIVHGENVSNRVKGRRTFLRNYYDIFPLLKDISTDRVETKGQVALENSLVTPIRSACEVGRSGLKLVRDAVLRR